MRGRGCSGFPGGEPSGLWGARRPAIWHPLLSVPRKLATFVLLLASCGARTGLRVDPSVEDAAVEMRDAWSEAGPTCTPDIVLAPARADVVLLIDRSGSMNRPLASDPMLRWDALRTALATSLPPFDESIAFGASIFPVPEIEGDRSTVCVASATLDVPVGARSVSAVLDAVDAHGPAGGTPTTAALEVAFAALRARAGPGVTQAVALTTDGGPNCDPVNAGEVWFGIAPETCPDMGIALSRCLDDDRAIAVMERGLASGIPTYVIGMDVTEPVLVDAINRMAVAGGRPRDGAERFFDVRRPGDLGDAFAELSSEVASCAFVPIGTIETEEPIVRVDGMEIARDDTRADGWTRGASGTFELSGVACDRARRTGAVVVVDGICR